MLIIVRATVVLSDGTKPNQIGSISETMLTIRIAKCNRLLEIGLEIDYNEYLGSQLF